MHDEASKCEKCGASVYREHLDAGIARYENGMLMCSFCVTEYEREHDGDDASDESLAPIEFDDDGGSSDLDMSESRVQVSSKAQLSDQQSWDDSKYTRPIDPKSPGAVRCRTFHSKLSQGAIDFMDNQINEWLDKNTKIEIKFVNSTIGVFEGKHAEPNIIMTLFY